ncbi:MAG: glycosyltransferase [Acidobacteria bacterium]|nr:glycosyltransferase [Acidobacteriota bacterium]
MRDAPLVSAVIPACRRPAAAARAVRSALAQSWSSLEVIVVPACPDTDLGGELASIADPRLRILEPRRLGASEARNRGVRAAAGRWVAFLDDDDEWSPRKIELQAAAAEASPQARPVVSCRLRARWSQGELVWPRRVPAPGEAIGDYLFRRQSLFGGGGLVQTSTLFAPRELLLELPFREDLRIAEDLDWVLRAERAGSRVEFAGTEPLALWDIEDDRPRLSSAPGAWREALAWIRDERELVSPEAYASYLLTWVSAEAAREGGGWKSWRELWREARRGGRPSLLDAAVHAGHFLAPPKLLRRLATWATGRGRQTARSASLEKP